MPIDQTKRTGRGTKDSPFTDIQIQDLANDGIIEGKADSMGRILQPGGFFNAPTSNAGITTSDSASNAVEQGRNDLNNLGSDTGSTTGSSNGIQDQLSKLFAQLSETRGKLTEAKEREKVAKENLTNADMQSKLNAIDPAEEARNNDLKDGVNAINDAGAGGEGDTSMVDEPLMKGMSDATINYVKATQGQITRLDAMRQSMSDFSQADIDDISATAARSVEREIAENARIKRGMEFAGIIGGRAQFAPRTEKSLINQIVKDGLDRINVIEENKNTAIREARQAELEFDYALFTEKVGLVKDLHKEIEDGITNLKAEVRQAEKDEQDRITFRQQQEDRNSVVLAPELFEETKDMTAEEQQAYLSKVSVANDIPLGSLMREVQVARDEALDREFNESNNALVLQNRQNTLNNAGETTSGLIGDFNAKDSETLIANGLQDVDIATQRLFLAGGVDDRREILEQNAALDTVQTFEEVDTLVREKMDLLGTAGADVLDDALYAQADKFGTGLDRRGAQGDVRAYIRVPAVKKVIDDLLASGKTTEEVLKIISDDEYMTYVKEQSEKSK